MPCAINIDQDVIEKIEIEVGQRKQWKYAKTDDFKMYQSLYEALILSELQSAGP